MRGDRVRQRRSEINRVIPGSAAVRGQAIRLHVDGLADAEVRAGNAVVRAESFCRNIAVAVPERDRTIEIGADRIVRAVEELVVDAFGEDIAIVVADDDRRPHLRLAEIWIALLDFDMEVGVGGNGDVVETDIAVSAARSHARLKLIDAALVNREVDLDCMPGFPVGPNIVGDIAD